MKDNITRHPDGYYVLSYNGCDHQSLVYLYGNKDFNGIRHVSFGHIDGGGLIPISDIEDGAIFRPAAVVISPGRPSNEGDIDKL